MPDALYDHDALAWSEQQAALLRRLADGEDVDAAVDWANVIEEVQDVGQSQLRAYRSLFRQALVHLLKLHAWPTSPAVPQWRSEALALLVDAEDRFSPSMRRHIEIAVIYAKALRQAHAAIDELGEPRSLPPVCPVTLDELLAGDVVTLVGSLGQR